MIDKKRVKVNCRMPCNHGSIRDARKAGERAGQEGCVPCPEKACPYNKFGDRFDNWFIKTAQPNPVPADAGQSAPTGPGAHRCSLFCDNSICVVASRLNTLEKPKLYIAVWHVGHPDICAACSLRAECDELFGSRGAACQIHRKGQRWVLITEAQPAQLAALLCNACGAFETEKGRSLRFICKTHGEVKPIKIGYSSPLTGWCPDCEAMLTGMTDTDRLDFLLRFISIDDVGDEVSHPGAVVVQEDLEAALSASSKADACGRHANICEFGDDLRAVIDRAIALNSSRQKERDAICAKADAGY